MSKLEWIRHEVREIGLTTLYFLICFLLFLSLKKLLLIEYDIEIEIFHRAVIGALIVGKVVVVLDKSAIGDRFRSGRIASHVFWRSFIYTAIVFFVSLLERVFDFYRETGGLSEAVAELWASRDFSHFMAQNLCVGISFVAYNTFTEIDRLLGEGGLRKALFSKEATAD